MGRSKTPTGPPVLPALDSDDWVEIYPEHGLAQPTARELLDVAERLGYDPRFAVRSGGGGFQVPKAVLTAATLPTTPVDSRSKLPTPLAAAQKGATPPGADATE